MPFLRTSLSRAARLVGDRDRQRHQLRGVVAGVAEHQPLVAGALPVERVDGVVVTLLVGVVDALRDVGRLRADRDLTPQERAVEALVAAVVADLEDPVARELRDRGVGLGGDLAGDDDEPGGHQRLDRDPAVRVVGEQRVEDACR